MIQAANLLYHTPIFRLAGDRGLLMEFGNVIDPAINARIFCLTGRLYEVMPPGVEEIIPTYCAIILIYDSITIDPETLIPRLTALNKELNDQPRTAPGIIELPVCYHPDLCFDLVYVAKIHYLTLEEVMEIHTAPLYPIYMIGFIPGFPYLGGLSERLHTTRLSSPRTHVPADSVGIANNHTGIYPIASPGGWQIIGQCPVKLFDSHRENPILLSSGSMLKFNTISLDEFWTIKEENL